MANFLGFFFMLSWAWTWTLHGLGPGICPSFVLSFYTELTVVVDGLDSGIQLPIQLSVRVTGCHYAQPYVKG